MEVTHVKKIYITKHYSLLLLSVCKLPSGKHHELNMSPLSNPFITIPSGLP